MLPRPELSSKGPRRRSETGTAAFGRRKCNLASMLRPWLHAFSRSIGTNRTPIPCLYRRPPFWNLGSPDKRVSASRTRKGREGGVRIPWARCARRRARGRGLRGLPSHSHPSPADNLEREMICIECGVRHQTLWIQWSAGACAEQRRQTSETARRQQRNPKAYLE